MIKALLLGIGIGLIVTATPDPFALPALFLLSIWATIRIVSWNLNKVDTQKINALLMFIGEVGTLLFLGKIRFG